MDRSAIQSLARIVGALLIVVASRPAFAQSGSQEDRLREQLRQTTLQLRAQQDDNAVLKSKLLNQEDELSRLRTTAAPAAKPQAAVADASAELRRRLKSEAANSDALRLQFEQSQAELAQAQKAISEGKEQLQIRDAAVTRTETAVAAGQQSLQGCLQNNARLIDIGNDLLRRYRDKGPWTALWQAEPLTGLERVELETLSDDIRHQLRDQRYTPPESGEPK